MNPRIVLDTNVLISALHSKRGASYKLLKLVGKNRFSLCISVPLVLEYESVAKKLCRRLVLEPQDIDDILDYLCSVSERRQIFYLWRPFLKDPKDDLLLELAVEANAEHIVNHNVRHFRDIEQFGPTAITPQAFLAKIGA